MRIYKDDHYMEITIDKVTYLISFETLVAVKMNDNYYIREEYKDYSRATNNHLNRFVDYTKNSYIRDEKWFKDL